MKKWMLALCMICIGPVLIGQDKGSNQEWTGDWVGKWSCSRYFADTDSYSPAHGTTIIRIEEFDGEYVVRIKETDESADPPVVRYINGIKVASCSEDKLYIQYPYGDCYTRFITLCRKHNFLSMTAKQKIDWGYGSDQPVGKACPVEMVHEYNVRNNLRELKLFRVSGDW